MYRNRWHFYPQTFAGWDEVVAIAREYEAIAAAKGWAKGAFWTQMVGRRRPRSSASGTTLTWRPTRRSSPSTHAPRWRGSSASWTRSR